MVMCNTFIRRINDGLNLSDVTFKLKEYGCDGKIMETSYHGLYLIVDNGFLSLVITVPPHKQSIDIRAI